MKRLISMILLFIMLLSLCACGTTPAEPTAEATEPTEEATRGAELNFEQTPEQLYGHIDQTVPEDGAYKLWNADGIKSIADHPDGTFELLCNIDMAGATLAPIGEFTGIIKGAHYVISNFTVQGGDETDFGFICVNKGNIMNLTLDQVTFLPGANTKNIGTIAGTNSGRLNRCNVNGRLVVEQAAADAACGALVGVNTGSVINAVSDVAVNYTAEGTAYVGGLVGITTGGTFEYLENHGALTVTGENKTVGLFAGQASDAVFTGCVFGGSDNSLNGQLFTNFTGNPEDDELTVAVKALWRDNAAITPLPENVAAIRQKAVDAMYDLCTVEWYVEKDMPHSCNCQLTACHGVYKAGYTYKGIPYNHKGSSVARVTYCLNEEKTINEWMHSLPSFDGFDTYIGGDCSSTVQQAWWTVSNSTDILNTEWIPEVKGRGTITVGPYKCDYELTGQKLTEQYTLDNGEQVMYESYAAMRYGDIIVNRLEEGGHTRMVSVDPVIVRGQSGQIDGNYSYVLCHENVAMEMIDEETKTISTCRTDYKWSFAALFSTAYVPVTCEELLTGEMETPEAKLEGGCDGYGGMFTGTVSANYQLDYVKLTVVNENGETVLDHPLFTTVSKANVQSNYFTARTYTDWLNLADFAMVLSNYPLEAGHIYSYTLTAGLATFDQIQVHEGSFTYGAQ